MVFLQGNPQLSNLSTVLMIASTVISFVAAILTMYVTMRINGLKVEVMTIANAMKTEITAMLEVKVKEVKADLIAEVKELESKMVTRENMGLLKENMELKMKQQKSEGT